MRCPNCNSLNTEVQDSRKEDDVVKRRRVCGRKGCGTVFHTEEKLVKVGKRSRGRQRENKPSLALVSTKPKPTSKIEHSKITTVKDGRVVKGVVRKQNEFDDVDEEIRGDQEAYNIGKQMGWWK